MKVGAEKNIARVTVIKKSILNMDEDFTPEVIPTPQPAFEGFDNIEELISQFDGEYNSSKALDEL